MLQPTPSTTQRDVTALRDNVGGHQYNTNSNNLNFNVLSCAPSPISAWMERLAEEIRSDAQVQQFIDTLQFYIERHSHDGVDGLEGKLNYSGRSAEINMAVRKKELFTRLLAKYSMFDSAQQIFAYMLSKIERDYTIYVLPNIGMSSPADVDLLIHERLVSPAVAEVGAGVFSLNAAIATGMVYWLAEQCYIRWHA
jgi:hypothetical protein